MKFSKLLPQLGSASGLSTREQPTWTLSFLCPLCQQQTSVAVSGRPPSGCVWKLTPDPMAMLDSIQTGELIEVQWARIWDAATVEPSMQNLPHARQIKCTAHFSVSNGEIILS